MCRFKLILLGARLICSVPGMDLLTVNDLALRLKLSPWTVRKYIHAGRLKATRMGRRFRVDPRDLTAFIEKAGEKL